MSELHNDRHNHGCDAGSLLLYLLLCGCNDFSFDFFVPFSPAMAATSDDVNFVAFAEFREMAFNFHLSQKYVETESL